MRSSKNFQGLMLTFLKGLLKRPGMQTTEIQPTSILAVYHSISPKVTWRPFSPNSAILSILIWYENLALESQEDLPS